MATCARLSSFGRLVLGGVLLSLDSLARAGAAISIESLPFESGHTGKADGGVGRGAEKWCEVGELLPQATTADLSSEWSTEFVVEPPYGCDCASIKSRYFCPSLGREGYPKWVPHSVATGACKSVSRGELTAEGPLPPDFKVLFYGNSHMRQVVESILCLFGDKVAVKRVTRFSPSSASEDRGNGVNNNHDDEAEASPPSPYKQFDALLSGETQCRACFDIEEPPHSVNKYEREMQENECIAEGEDCRCNDDHAEFFFDNGAIVHYYFASTSKNKNIADALQFHGGAPFSYYDAVFANNGNRPHMSMESLLDVAAELQAEGVQLFWLSTYEGYGALGKSKYWSEEQVARFRESGARFVGIDRMTRGLLPYTKGEVEGIKDPHFCLPGPPNEFGLLLLKLMWAMHLHDDVK